MRLENTSNAQALSMVEPAILRDGLAIYSIGQGEPLLLMPYPHASAPPIEQNQLAQVLSGLGRRVITFDAPGMYRSTRQAAVSMPVMLGCAEEALPALGIQGAVDVLGHSMGGLCALAYALEHPDRVKRLALIGSLSGWPAIRRYRCIPYNLRWTDANFWRTLFWGTRLILGVGNLAVHKRLDHLMDRLCFVDQSYVPQLEITPDDHWRPAPVRDGWLKAARKLDYRDRLGEIRAPTLILVGRFDPQTTVACNEELARGIPGAQLAIFERSGHHPFIEEPEQFASVLRQFWVG